MLLAQSFYGAWSDGAGSFVHYKKVTPREALKTLQDYPITLAQFTSSIYIKALDEGSHDSFKFPTLKRFFRDRGTIKQGNATSLERKNRS